MVVLSECAHEVLNECLLNDTQFGLIRRGWLQTKYPELNGEISPKLVYKFALAYLEYHDRLGSELYESDTIQLDVNFTNSKTGLSFNIQFCEKLKMYESKPYKYLKKLDYITDIKKELQKMIDDGKQIRNFRFKYTTEEELTRERNNQNKKKYSKTERGKEIRKHANKRNYMKRKERILGNN